MLEKHTCNQKPLRVETLWTLYDMGVIRISSFSSVGERHLETTTPLPISLDGDFIEIPKAHLQFSGMDDESTNTILMKTKVVAAQLERLRVFSESPAMKRRMVVYGPPGTGKSSTTLAWAAARDPKCWLYLHVSIREDAFTTIIVDDGTRRTCRDFRTAERINEFMETIKMETPILFVLDGFIENRSLDETLLGDSLRWLEKSDHKIRFILNTSMSTADRKSLSPIYNEKMLIINWTLEECVAAALHRPFFERELCIFDGS